LSASKYSNVTNAHALTLHGPLVRWLLDDGKQQREALFARDLMKRDLAAEQSSSRASKPEPKKSPGKKRKSKVVVDENDDPSVWTCLACSKGRRVPLF